MCIYIYIYIYTYIHKHVQGATPEKRRHPVCFTAKFHLIIIRPRIFESNCEITALRN